MSEQNVLIDLYARGLHELALQGVVYQRKIKDAKTSTKKKYYQKKAKANSEDAARLLVKLERLAPGSVKEIEDGLEQKVEAERRSTDPAA